ncbi:hypothetical protein EXIGLDRAFT_844120 [Exidia glandulosa HHB12029]|uniref:Uncharacterized protein n=1 Tax=Exidia glandulosa HHB12029 TaxID=1314781 RepID=A0A165C8P5_EXIGL|nr:hypothetical protein EXIGLDRAFT_844120 [Exidia glandulosa HHB12029]
MGLPIISASGDFTSAAPILIFTPTYDDDKSKGPTSWSEATAVADRFRMIHDVKLLPRSNGDLDMVVVAGQEGIVLLWYDTDNEEWSFNVVGEGLPAPSGAPYFDDAFWGSGGIEICRVDDDDVGYIAACEAFHGHIVSVYVKSSDAPKGPSSLKTSSYWTRKVIDDYGPLDTTVKRPTGPLHHVMAVPLAKVATEAFAVACMGVPSGDKSKQGVYLYEPFNVTDGKFKKVRVTGESAGRLAVADYSGTNRMDIASLSYYVPGYFTGPDPPQLRINTVGNRESQFWASKLENEVLLRIPRPRSLDPDAMASLPFWALAGKTLAIVVLPPHQRRVLESGVVAIKVIFGQVEVTDSEGKYSSARTIAPDAKKSQTTLVPPSGAVKSGDDGVVFIAVAKVGNSMQGPFTSMSQVTSVSAMPHTDNIAPEVASLVFPFFRVDQLPWATSGLWNDFEFYNASGFHIYFNDDWMDRIVHIQAWTLGIGETARFHVHSGTGRSFCEIHYCLSNGGGAAGMRYCTDDFADSAETIQKNELTKKYVEDNSTLIVVPDLDEHGPLWKIQKGTKATPKLLSNGAVDYPWHAWLASKFGDYSLPIKPPLGTDKQKFDVWLAFEFPLSAFQF